MICALLGACHGDNNGTHQTDGGTGQFDGGQDERPDGSVEGDGDASQHEGPDASDDVDASADGDEHLAEQMVGPAGGTISLADGLSIEIPAGALADDTVITIDEVFDVETPEGAVAVGRTYEFGPSGITFDQAVKVILPWDGGDVPVVIAHALKGGTDWSVLDDGDSDDTHVWAYTQSFSWFRPVYYQGAIDAPIVLEGEDPVWPKAVALESSRDISLYGAGFRTDTVVKVFKDGVETATISKVTLTRYGLSFTLPSAFTEAVGLITIQAKNPQADKEAITTVYAIEQPILESLSPSSHPVEVSMSGEWNFSPLEVTVEATSLPADPSICWVNAAIPFGEDSEAPAQTSDISWEEWGFSFTITDVQVIGAHKVRLICGDVISNALTIDLERVKTP